MSDVTEFIIRVTATDIRKGKRGWPGSCALAIAISRALNQQVWVQDRTFAGYEITGRLSQDAQDFRFDFDQSKNDVGPRSFCLNFSRKQGDSNG